MNDNRPFVNGLGDKGGSTVRPFAVPGSAMGDAMGSSAGEAEIGGIIAVS
jgi:hypothetical protein